MAPSWGGYDRYLNNVLSDRLEVASPFHFFTVARYHEQNKDICAIHVQPADRSVFLDDQLYVRVGAQNKPVEGREILSFVVDRWSSLGDQAKSRESRLELESLAYRSTR